MRAYIAHGEADQAIAEELQEYLKPLGLFAETESGARGFRHLQKSDVVIALWSRNALFTVQRMQLEKRMLDAWADGQLILVKLDHNFLPVGMRDLPYIDATFEQARKMTAWRDVAREAKERINKLLVEQQEAAQNIPPQNTDLKDYDAGDVLRPSDGAELGRAAGGSDKGLRSAPEPQKKFRSKASQTSPPPMAPHASKGGSWFLPASAIVLVLALLAVGANVLMDRLSGTHGDAPAGEVVEVPVEAGGQDMRVTADFLAMLETADIENGAVEAAKCQMCHAFTADGPAMLGPPLYDLIGKDIASHDGFAYSTGEGGLADIEGVWTYRNLDQFLERPKSVAENTTMFFVGERRPQARADLIAYLRTLTPGELAPLPEALPPGVTYDAGASDSETPADTPEAPDEAEETDSGPLRQLQDASDGMLRQPLMIAGIALLLCALMVLVIKLTRDSARKNRIIPNPAAAAPEEPELDEGARRVAAEELALADALGAEDTLFISYAHDDNERVDPVVKIVKSNGREVWIDKGGIQAGDGWAGEIVRAIKAAGGVMVMCSQRAFESDHIKREIYLADRYKKQILPIFLEEAQPPEDFEYFFAGVQWLELFKLPEADRAGAIGRALSAV